MNVKINHQKVIMNILKEICFYYFQSQDKTVLDKSGKGQPFNPSYLNA